MVVVHRRTDFGALRAHASTIENHATLFSLNNNQLATITEGEVNVNQSQRGQQFTIGVKQLFISVVG